MPEVPLDSMTAISRPPAPKTSTSGMRRTWNSPTWDTRKYPTTAFSVPQSTFTIGEDNPLPGGEAKGVGNERPETPLTKCGIAFTRKAPPKK